MNSQQPYIINKNLGQPLGNISGELPSRNSDGLSVIPLTDEQKYVFDKDGWLVIENVLSGDELCEMRDYAVRIRENPESIPKHLRTPLAMPLQRLLDHPVVVGFLNEFTAYPPLSSQDCYGFGHSFCNVMHRKPGEAGLAPHNGSGLLRFPEDVHFYEAHPGKAHSPHTRFVWELNPVKEKQGGTLFVTGSHKGAYAAPEEIQDPDSDVWSSYSCPAGSLIIFAEATTHSASEWKDKEHDRVAIFSLYNPVDSGWSPQRMPHPEIFESMPPMRRTLFRNRHVADNLPGGDFRRLYDG
ncbi:MAG: phytanoyl-CoA dioxygenase family protein [Planctomycetota bacterium]|nr:phytanoyl-CoA dioxygenase family protein [Planctomycetota bacterium]MDA1141791.1 phytanoyl-CoA dioxygenase family protein [Planctomycetota bacterium]